MTYWKPKEQSYPSRETGTGNSRPERTGSVGQCRPHYRNSRPDPATCVLPDSALRISVRSSSSTWNLERRPSSLDKIIGAKTAILDALRIALTRRWGQRGTGFTEYDVHLATDADDPKQSTGIVIEIRAEEVVPGEWPEALQQGLDEIVQADPSTGRSFSSRSA